MKKFLLFAFSFVVALTSAFADSVKFDFTNPTALTPAVEPAGESAGVNIGGTEFTNGGVTFIAADGTSTNQEAKIWTGTAAKNYATQLRTYTTGTMTFTAPAEKYITAITFSSTINVTASVGTYAKGAWTGSANSVVFTCGATCKIDSIVVTFGDAGETPVVPDPVVDPTPTAGTGDGTLDNPFDAAAATSVASALTAGDKTQNDYYIKGKVSEIKEQFGSAYGNASFCISADGTTEGQFLVWRALYLKNAKYKDGQDTIKLGDEVVICGKLMNYLNSKDNTTTVETVQGEAYLYSLNGKTESVVEEPEAPAAEGDGTIDNPYNTTGVINYINTLESNTESAEKVYIKGKICKITSDFSTQYGNATFSISADGEAANSFLIYRAYYLNNKKYADSADVRLNVGDDVIICGKVINYKGNTPETVAGQAFIYSLNGTVSSINNAAIKPEATKQSIYTLDGRKVNAATKGVFIINGKKVIK